MHFPMSRNESLVMVIDWYHEGIESSNIILPPPGNLDVSRKHTRAHSVVSMLFVTVVS